MDYQKNDLKGEYKHKIHLGYKSSLKQAKKPVSELLDEGEVKRVGKSVGIKKSRALNRGPLDAITKPSIRRLARRGGVRRISGLVYAEARMLMKTMLKKTIKDSIAYAETRRRTTVGAVDCLAALQRQGRGIYGALVG